MKMLKVEKLTVGEHDFYIKTSTRSMIEYEELSGKSIANLNTTNDLLKFFYTTAKAGAKSEGVDFKYTYDEFLDLIDDYPTEALNGFRNALDKLGQSDKKKVTKKTTKK